MAYFVQFRVLTAFASTFPEALKHVNTFYSRMRQQGFQEQSPSIWVPHEDEGSLRLHYRPGTAERNGLEPLVVGLVKGLAELVFELEELEITQRSFTSRGAPHNTFKVVWKFDEVDEVTTAEALAPHRGIGPEQLNIIQPFHLAWEAKSGKLLQAGFCL